MVKEKFKRGYKNPTSDIDDLGVNPFSINMRIPVNKKITDVINKFGDTDTLEFMMDAGRCGKLYEYDGQREELITLSLRSTEMLMFILSSIKMSEDFIWIDKVSYMSNMKMKSINTFKSAINPLVNKFLIKHETVKDIYWINPARIFNGSRVNKFPNKLEVKQEVRKNRQDENR